MKHVMFVFHKTHKLKNFWKILNILKPTGIFIISLFVAFVTLMFFWNPHCARSLKDALSIYDISKILSGTRKMSLSFFLRFLKRTASTPWLRFSYIFCITDDNLVCKRRNLWLWFFYEYKAMILGTQNMVMACHKII